MPSPLASAPRVLQVNVQMDELRREPEALLEAWPTLVDVAEAARGAGLPVTVIQAAHREARVERNGVDYRFVRERAPSWIQRRAGPWATPPRRRVDALAGSMGADVVHVHGLAFPLHVRSLARRTRLPVVVQDRAEALPPAWRRPLDRSGLAAASAVLFTAKEQAGPWRKAGILPPGVPTLEVPGGSSRFTPGNHPQARARTGIHGDPAVLWVGRLTREKDPLTALEAVALASEQLPDLQFWCCFGQASSRVPVSDRLARDERLAGRVHLLGAVPHRQVEHLCRAADLFLSTSRGEATGFALLEALACGLTPVVTEIPSFRRMTGGRVGSLVPAGDAEGFARALVRHARDERDRARTRVAAHFRDRLSFPAWGRRLRAAYELAMERPSNAPVGRVP